jgi:general secretion pathway protein D
MFRLGAFPLLDRVKKISGNGAVVWLVLLAGCGAQSVRNDAQGLIKAGNYEEAIRTYEAGALRYPDSIELRADIVSARQLIVARLLASASEYRAGGNDDAAQSAVQRALTLDARNSRAQAMALDIARDRRQKAAIDKVRDLLDKGMRERAYIFVEAALKDDPKNPQLLSLQRELETEAKQFELNEVRLSETRPVSLDFKDANLRSVLDLLTRNSGVNFVIDKDVRPDLRATIFMRQTRLDDALTLIAATNQLAFKVIDASTVLIFPRNPEKLKEYQDLMIRAFYLSSADVKQTAMMLKTMLKIKDPFIDEKLNMIMVRETPETIRLAERLIALHDIAEPEVTIEMEVLEVKRSALTELGIKYPDSFTLTPLVPEGAQGFTLGNVRSLNRDLIGINLPKVTLNLHRDVGDVNILANPRIRTRNREKANVMIGDKLPVVTTTGNAANNSFISESVQYVDVGLKLNVEPTIYLDDEVAIKVGLEVSSMVSEIKTSGGSLVYQIGTRMANTVLRLRDGETQLLAGLINNEERMSANRVPGAGDLPLVGRLFSSQRDSGQRTEIVLSITPHIVRNIRRPDLNQTEFWSGTESDLRSRPLASPPARKAVADDLNGKSQIAASPAAGAAPGSANALGESFALGLFAPSEVAVGETFAVTVQLKTNAPVRGIPVQIEFSKDRLEVQGVEEGGFFNQAKTVTSVSKGLDQAAGRASMAILRNSVEGVKGEGTLMTFRFKALTAGPAQVRLVSADAIASGQLDQPPLPDATKIMVK